ncbi:hypothetical protein AAFP30_05560 [Gordonia sp. CPCC 205515]|uniref:hypothetical protein n=1 Tax=Gordonia sp. CPCC 205515 TaxID=3140791 RepID=UPI003AF345FE
MPFTAGSTAIDFSFPEVHVDATLRITFHRTLRVPDDATTYGLPPSLGALDIRAARDTELADRADVDAILPLWQSEATWIDFTSPAGYPFLVNVGVGGISAISGETYSPQPDFASEDYFEVPTQPWLDGFRADATTVRQFVAMPLGDGYSAAEQLTGADDGLIRLAVAPLNADIWSQRLQRSRSQLIVCAEAPPSSMGLGAGGSIQQSIATPLEPQENWALDSLTEVRLQIVNSSVWQSLTGTPPHHEPLTINEYLAHEFPWFEWYDDSLARQGESRLNQVKSVHQVGDEKGTQPLPDNISFDPPIPHIVGG